MAPSLGPDRSNTTIFIALQILSLSSDPRYPGLVFCGLVSAYGTAFLLSVSLPALLMRSGLLAYPCRFRCAKRGDSVDPHLRVGAWLDYEPQNLLVTGVSSRQKAVLPILMRGAGLEKNSDPKECRWGVLNILSQCGPASQARHGNGQNCYFVYTQHPGIGKESKRLLFGHRFLISIF